MRLYALNRSRASYAIAAALLLVVLVAVGREIGHDQTRYPFALIAVLALGALATFEPGAAVGVLALAAMDGVPFFETARPLTSHVSYQDVAMFALVACALAWRMTSGRAQRPTRTVRTVSILGAGLLAWWTLTLARSNAPAFAAAQFGSDFLAFAVLLILLPGVRLRPRDVRALLAVLGAGVAVFAVGQILTVEGIGIPSGVIHSTASAAQNGLIRVYSPMVDGVSAGVALCIAALFLGRRARTRWIAIPLLVLLGASLVLQLTRARWLALIASIVVVSLWFALQGERHAGARLRRWLGGLLAALVGAVTVLMLVAPSANVGGAVAERFLSTFTDIGSSNSATSTVAVRTSVAHDMLTVLGGKWPIGVGFIPPSAHYYALLPKGSLRDVDLGVLNAVMTMGVIGAVLVFAPLVVVLMACMRAARTTDPGRRYWLIYGGQLWIVATIGSSLTLVTLFSKSGLAMSAVMVAVLCQPEVIGAATQRASSAPDPLAARIGRRPGFDAQIVPGSDARRPRAGPGGAYG